jgi:hypothetical protein
MPALSLGIGIVLSILRLVDSECVSPANLFIGTASNAAFSYLSSLRNRQKRSGFPSCSSVTERLRRLN